MSFKLIAIRPLKGCDKKFLKNLKEGEIYNFYNDYEFILDNEDVREIKYCSTIPENLFNVSYFNDNLINDKKEININISAVVGKNGSGKSALSELFLYSLFIISNKLRFIFKSSFIKGLIETRLYDSDLKIIKKGVFVEIYYLKNDCINILRISSNTILLQKTYLNENSFKLKNDWVEVSKRSDLFPFFYSMIINYSFYGFNTNQIGIWLKSFFHKNDGYRMPIVINPYREEGNINVNNETYLTRSRLLANILSIEDYKDINSKSNIKTIVLFRDQKKFDKYKLLENKSTPRFSEEFINDFIDKILKPLYVKMFSYKIRGKIVEPVYPLFERRNENDNRVLAEIYIINKLIVIPSRYESFKDYDFRKNKTKDVIDNYQIEELIVDDYITDLYEDRSHVTLKLRQTLNFIRKNIFDIPQQDAKIELELDYMVKVMNEIKKENLFTEIIDYVPPPFFFSEIIFEDTSSFTQLSSGEKQQIFSLNSIIYHLKNIDSVHKSVSRNRQLLKYDSINIFFDEIELYFHPDFQKNYISKLLNLIKDAKYKNLKNINLVFLTHSPFILSDIPNQNIMYLVDGNCLKQNDRPQKSFGANIHELLADSFFINNGLIGDFAKSKIEITLNWLKIKANEIQKSMAIEENKQELHFFIDPNIEILTFESSDEENKYHKEIIGLIDEPLVQNKLRNMYLEYIKDDELYKNDEIRRLEMEIEKLK